MSSFDKKFTSLEGTCSRGNEADRRVFLNTYNNSIMVRKKRQSSSKNGHQTELWAANENSSNTKWVGNDFSHKLHRSATRFVLLNCNGLESSKDANKFKSQLTSVLERDVQFFGMVETNVNSRNFGVKEKMIQSFAEIVPSGIFELTNTPVLSTLSRYQPGGVATGFFGRLGNRYAGVNYDSCGRWLSQKFHGKDGRVKIYTLLWGMEGGWP